MVAPYTPYSTLWDRVRRAEGKRVCLRVLKNQTCAWNTGSRLRRQGMVPKGIELTYDGPRLMARLAHANGNAKK